MAKLYGLTTGNTYDQELTAKGTMSTFDPADGDFGSPVLIASKTYELSSQAANDELVIHRANPGMRIHEIFMKFDALGGSVQLRIGDDDDDDRFITDFAVSSAGSKSTASDGTIDGFSFYYDPATFSVGKDIICTIKNSAATGTVKAQVFYSFPSVSIPLYVPQPLS
tara:strand:+ start:1598 stop:2098 length:501 start_codon:yes stop_codon:yes gene_type:complete